MLREVTLTIRNPPAMQQTQVQFLGGEDPSILAWKILWTEEPGGLQPIGSQRVKHI